MNFLMWAFVISAALVWTAAAKPQAPAARGPARGAGPAGAQRSRHAVVPQSIRSIVEGRVETGSFNALPGVDYTISGDAEMGSNFRIQGPGLIVDRARDERGNSIPWLRGKHLRIIAENDSVFEACEGRRIRIEGLVKDGSRIEVATWVPPELLTMEAKEENEKALIAAIRLKGPGAERFRIPEILPLGGRREAMTLKGTVQQTTLGEAMGCSIIRLYPGDRDPDEPFNINTTAGGYGLLPGGAGSVWRFVGPVVMRGKVSVTLGYKFFEGVESDPLAFVLLDRWGLVYLGGRGRLVKWDGTEQRLGQD